MMEGRAPFGLCHLHPQKMRASSRRRCYAQRVGPIAQVYIFALMNSAMVSRTRFSFP